MVPRQESRVQQKYKNEITLSSEDWTLTKKGFLDSGHPPKVPKRDIG